MSDQRVSDQRMSDQRVSDQRVSDQRVSDQRVSDQRVSSQRMSDQRVSSQRMNSPLSDGSAAACRPAPTKNGLWANPMSAKADRRRPRQIAANSFADNSFADNSFADNSFADNSFAGRSRAGCSHAGRSTSSGRVSAGFTLIEMLVVIAITLVLFTLLLRPLVESLRLTQDAQVQAAAQDSGRITMERITRELASAVYVYDNDSHPFVNYTATGSVTRYDKFTNFLNLEVTKSDGTAAVEQAFNAKLDIVPASHLANGGLTDPTNGNQPIQLPKPTVGPATVTGTGLLFPLAPGSTIIRYWIGLKQPVIYDANGVASAGLYSNSNEGLLAAASSAGDNTYVLYAATVQPYTSTTKNGVTTAAVNSQLFAANATTKVPELDDPDFFRYVSTSDTNWLDNTHPKYTAAEVTAHNTRVENWVKLAKPVITAPDIDLILLPHNPDGSINYDTTGEFSNIAHSGMVTDPVTSTDYPVVNTSVTFKPGLIQGDAAPGTTVDYASLGVPANAIDNGGLPYIPTLYTTSNKSWAYPYKISLYPQHLNNMSQLQIDQTKNFFYTDLGMYTQDEEDTVEYEYSESTAPVPVYDVTQGIAINGAQKYVPMSVNSDAGTINFETPALPVPSTLTDRYWTGGDTTQPYYTALLSTSTTALNNTAPTGGLSPGEVDLTQLPNSPLAPNGDPTASGAQSTAVANAYIVPGSVRVYGPDATPGPNLGHNVLYSLVSPGTPLDYNEYRVDTLSSKLYFYVDAAHQIPAPATGSDGVQVSFDYQANLSPGTASPLDTSGATTAIGAGNIAAPMLVKVDYSTKDLIDVYIGVRIYDSSQGRALVIPVENQVQIGNSNQ